MLIFTYYSMSGCADTPERNASKLALLDATRTEIIYGSLLSPRTDPDDNRRSMKWFAVGG